MGIKRGNKQRVCENCYHYSVTKEICTHENNSGEPRQPLDACTDWSEEPPEPEPGESQETEEIIEEETDANEEELKVKRDMPRTTSEPCKCVFTSDEMREMSNEMARKIGALEEKEAAKKAVASQYKADIESLSKEASELAAKLRNGFEYRQTKLYIEWDWKKKKVTYTRADTGEIHRERAMTVDELQTELDLEKGEK